MPLPPDSPGAEGQALYWGHFNGGGVFFIHLLCTDNGDDQALPLPVWSLPHLSVLQTPPPLPVPPHPIVGEPPHYVFQVNGFRCEHHVLIVAL